MKIFTLGRRHFTAWLACFAALLAAFAPSISYAMAPQPGNGVLVEICSSTGPALIHVADGQAPASPAPADKGHHADHCPSCFTHGGAYVPAGLPALPIAGNADLVPALSQRAPRPLFAWAASQPRAPPRLS